MTEFMRACVDELRACHDAPRFAFMGEVTSMEPGLGPGRAGPVHSGPGRTESFRVYYIYMYACMYVYVYICSLSGCTSPYCADAPYRKHAPHALRSA